MKVRLTKVLALSLMLFAATGTQAQSTTDVDGITSATQQTASRQPRSHGPRMTVDSLNTYMTANLNLTSTQLEKVKALNAEYSDIIEGPKPPRGHHGGGQGNGRPAGPAPERNANEGASSADTTSRRNPFAMMATRQQSYDTALRAILDDSQYAAYEKVKPAFASQRRRRMPMRKE